MNPGSLPRGRLLAFLELAAVLFSVPLLGIVAVSLTGVVLEDGISGTELLLVKLVELPLMLGFLALVLRWQGRSLAALGWRFPARENGPDLKRGLLWVIPLLILAIAVSSLLQMLGFEATKPFDLGGILDVAALLAVGIIAGGIIEELVFRGFVFQQIEALLPRKGGAGAIQAAALTSLVFAFLHAYEGPAAVGAILVISMGLQVLYLRSGRRLLAPMVCHAGFNSVQIFVLAAAGS